MDADLVAEMDEEIDAENTEEVDRERDDDESETGAGPLEDAAKYLSKGAPRRLA